jgi:hypothetical protein
MADEESDNPDFLVPFEAGGSGGAPMKRQYGDRRGLKHGVSYASEDTGGEIEEWLAANCTGKWSFELQDMAADLTRRTFLAMFEFETDKTRFMAMLQAKGGKKKGKAT